MKNWLNYWVFKTGVPMYSFSSSLFVGRLSPLPRRPNVSIYSLYSLVNLHFLFSKFPSLLRSYLSIVTRTVFLAALCITSSYDPWQFDGFSEQLNNRGKISYMVFSSSSWNVLLMNIALLYMLKPTRFPPTHSHSPCNRDRKASLGKLVHNLPP